MWMTAACVTSEGRASATARLNRSTACEPPNTSSTGKPLRQAQPVARRGPVVRHERPDGGAGDVAVRRAARDGLRKADRDGAARAGRSRARCGPPAGCLPRAAKGRAGQRRPSAPGWRRSPRWCTPRPGASERGRRSPGERTRRGGPGSRPWQATHRPCAAFGARGGRAGSRRPAPSPIRGRGAPQASGPQCPAGAGSEVAGRPTPGRCGPLYLRPRPGSASSARTSWTGSRGRSTGGYPPRRSSPATTSCRS